MSENWVWSIWFSSFSLPVVICCHMLVQSDNVLTVRYINHRSVTKSNFSLCFAWKLFSSMISLTPVSTLCQIWFSLVELASPLWQDALDHEWPHPLLYVFLLILPKLHMTLSLAHGSEMVGKPWFSMWLSLVIWIALCFTNRYPKWTKRFRHSANELNLYALIAGWLWGDLVTKPWFPAHAHNNFVNLLTGFAVFHEDKPEECYILCSVHPIVLFCLSYDHPVLIPSGTM